MANDCGGGWWESLFDFNGRSDWAIHLEYNLKFFVMVVRKVLMVTEVTPQTAMVNSNSESSRQGLLGFKRKVFSLLGR